MAFDAKKRSRSEDEPSLSQLRCDVRDLDREMLVQIVLELATTPSADYVSDTPLRVICSTVQGRLARTTQGEDKEGERSLRVVVKCPVLVSGSPILCCSLVNSIFRVVFRKTGAYWMMSAHIQ